MSKPGEHKTVRPRILAYAEHMLPCEEAEKRRGSSQKAEKIENHPKLTNFG